MRTKPDVTRAFHSWNVETTVVGRAGEHWISLDWVKCKSSEVVSLEERNSLIPSRIKE